MHPREVVCPWYAWHEALIYTLGLGYINEVSEGKTKVSTQPEGGRWA
jgi:hypothetical protein